VISNRDGRLMPVSSVSVVILDISGAAASSVGFFLLCWRTAKGYVAFELLHKPSLVLMGMRLENIVVV
jgi:hypothetical protein